MSKLTEIKSYFNEVSERYSSLVRRYKDMNDYRVVRRDEADWYEGLIEVNKAVKDCLEVALINARRRR